MADEKKANKAAGADKKPGKVRHSGTKNRTVYIKAKDLGKGKEHKQHMVPGQIYNVGEAIAKHLVDTKQAEIVDQKEVDKLTKSEAKKADDSDE